MSRPDTPDRLELMATCRHCGTLGPVNAWCGSEECAERTAAAQAAEHADRVAFAAQYVAPAEPVSSSVDGEAVETFDAGQPIVAGDLIEDMDGAPLPHELQTDGALFQAVLRVMCPSASAHDHGDCRELTGQTMAALAPILWPLLPSNDHSAASQASRPVVPVPARVDGETDEAAIRADERRRLSELLAEHAATIDGFAPGRATEMVAYLLTLGRSS